MEHENLIDGGIISVKEARKLLGAVSSGYSDTDLMQVVWSMATLSELLLDSISVPQKEIVRRTAARKLGDANREIKSLSEQEEKISNQIEATLHSFLVEKTISKDEKEFYIGRLEAQRNEIRRQREEQEHIQQLNESTITYVCNFLDKPAKLWKDADLESKRAFQQILFPNGLHIDLKEKCCGTEDLSPLYSVIGNKNEPSDGSNSPMVISAGVEPALTG